jgi:hypothetical protein
MGSSSAAIQGSLNRTLRASRKPFADLAGAVEENPRDEERTGGED